VCPVAKLRTFIYGDFYLRRQNERKQKRLPWQETVFTIADKVGRLSPQGGDLVQKNKGNHQQNHIDNNILRSASAGRILSFL